MIVMYFNMFELKETFYQCLVKRDSISTVIVDVKTVYSTPTVEENLLHPVLLVLLAKLSVLDQEQILRTANGVSSIFNSVDWKCFQLQFFELISVLIQSMKMVFAYPY